MYLQYLRWETSPEVCCHQLCSVMCCLEKERNGFMNCKKIVIIYQ